MSTRKRNQFGVSRHYLLRIRSAQVRHAGTVASVKETDAKPTDDLNDFFIEALGAALGPSRISDLEADRIAGLPKGTFGFWMRNQRTPTAPRFVQTCLALGLDPIAVVEDAMRRAEKAGALDDIKRLPKDEIAERRHRSRGFDESTDGERSAALADKPENKVPDDQ